jgi:hypothetical protein
MGPKIETSRTYPSLNNRRPTTVLPARRQHIQGQSYNINYVQCFAPGFYLGLGRFFSFVILYTVGMSLWTGDQSAARPLPTHKTRQTQNKRIQTSIP